MHMHTRKGKRMHITLHHISHCMHIHMYIALNALMFGGWLAVDEKIPIIMDIDMIGLSVVLMGSIDISWQGSMVLVIY